MQRDDETNAHQLHQMLLEHVFEISFRTILRCRTVLGWTFRGSAYCQLIREANKTKRLEWCQQYKDDNFDDVIWTDESTIQVEAHRRFVAANRGKLQSQNHGKCFSTRVACTYSLKSKLNFVPYYHRVGRLYK